MDRESSPSRFGTVPGGKYNCFDISVFLQFFVYVVAIQVHVIYEA